MVVAHIDEARGNGGDDGHDEEQHAADDRDDGEHQQGNSPEKIK